MTTRRKNNNGATAVATPMETTVADFIANPEMVEVDMEQPTVENTNSRLCKCGCGESVVSKKARFRVGHDARLKGQLLRAARAGNVEAEAELTRLGWSHFLIETKETRRAAAKAAAPAEKAAGGGE